MTEKESHRCGICSCTTDDRCCTHGVQCIFLPSAVGEACSGCLTAETLAASEAGRVWMERVIALAREGKYQEFIPSLAMQAENRRYEEQKAERLRQEKKAAEAAQSKRRGRTVPKWAVDLKAKAKS